ncbi:MAG: hypothetical protein ACR2PK_19320 [Acidimicrobiales bacterium]
MAAPNYVPARPDHVKYYESPPRRDDSWRAERPGDIPAGLPEGPGLGNQGPDQGYALKLVKAFESRVHLAEGERWEDAAAGGVLVALKRASLFGRAPVTQDLEIAFSLFGFLDPSPDPELVSARRQGFDRVDNPHHYLERRRIADSVPAELLKSSPSAVASVYSDDWTALIDLDVLRGPELHSDEFDD